MQKNDGHADLLAKSFVIEKLDENLFRSCNLITPRGARGTFGGQLIAHALQAATMTVDNQKKSHSLRSNFLGPGDSKIPMYYFVKRVRDGKSFSVRNVTAVQSGQAIYVATVSFQVPEAPGIEHQVDLPKNVPSIEEAVSEMDVISKLIGEKDGTLRENLLRKKAPIATIRYCDPYVNKNQALPKKDDAVPPTSEGYAWMKVDNLPDFKESPFSHRMAASFLSDFTLAISPVRPHGLPNPQLRMIASLDHTIYFHADFRADDWFLYQVHTTWAGGNRGLALGRMYSQQGKLVMSIFQEVVLRFEKRFHSVAKL